MIHFLVFGEIDWLNSLDLIGLHDPVENKRANKHLMSPFIFLMKPYVLQTGLVVELMNNLHQDICLYNSYSSCEID